MKRKKPVPIQAPGVAPPGGHYSHAVRHGDLVFISGQLPVPPDGAHAAEASFEDQARLVIANLLAVAEAAGSDRDHLLKVTVYIVDIDHWPAFDQIYAAAMGNTRPARAVVPVSALHHGYLIELEAVVALRDEG